MELLCRVRKNIAHNFESLSPTPRPLVNKPPPLNRDYNRDPNIQALKRRGFINHGSSLCKPITHIALYIIVGSVLSSIVPIYPRCNPYISLSPH